jgi:hypothetical protein
MTRPARMHGLDTSLIKLTVHAWLLNRVHFTFKGYKRLHEAV